MTIGGAIDAITSNRLMAIVRSHDLDESRRIVEALLEGGVRVVEFSLVGDSALPMLEIATRDYGNDILFGIGTVLTTHHAETAIAAGADFLISPDLNELVHVAAREADVLHIPGVFTPTDVGRAIRLEAPLLKLFPAAQLGPTYVRDLGGPFPGLRILASGGIGTQNAASFLAAGCVAVAVGGALSKADPDIAREFVRLTTSQSEG